DSLLFAAGAFAAKGDLKVLPLWVLVAIAAVLGDTANYWIGHYIGARAFSGSIRFLKKEYLDRTVAFYHKHGGKTIFLARFVPIIRTFAPFVAGVGQMHYGYFIRYNIVGGIVWTALFTFGGYFFGNLEIVQKNFSLVIIAIVLISLVPAVWEAVKGRRESAKQSESKAPVNEGEPKAPPKVNFD
ncbi:MAG TPA: VTT domain-containing protein, partial [Anaerolineaceae bacterium]